MGKWLAEAPNVDFMKKLSIKKRAVQKPQPKSNFRGGSGNTIQSCTGTCIVLQRYCKLRNATNGVKHSATKTICSQRGRHGCAGMRQQHFWTRQICATSICDSKSTRETTPLFLQYCTGTCTGLPKQVFGLGFWTTRFLFKSCLRNCIFGSRQAISSFPSLGGTSAAQVPFIIHF